jgi:hypothetical protein
MIVLGQIYADFEELYNIETLYIEKQRQYLVFIYYYTHVDVEPSSASTILPFT